MIKCIDVSSYQGLVDWEKVVKSGVQAAILKIIRKDGSPDNQFENNWKGCTEACMPIQGVYNYFYPAANVDATVQKAATDANIVIKTLNGRKAFVWLDYEDKSLYTLGAAASVRIINEYAKVITGAGLGFGVYTGLSFYNDIMKPVAGEIKYPFWIARYPSNNPMDVSANPADDKRPVILHDMAGWQYSSKGQVPGILGNVDMNELYVAVETENVQPTPESNACKYKVGDEITVSSYYNSSVDSISKAIIKENAGVIMKVRPGTANPYCFGKNGVALGWCNDGDIRSCNGTGDKVTAAPTAVYHVVKAGDNLTKIAKTYGTTVDAIVKLNGLKNKNLIRVNQKLRVK